MRFPALPSLLSAAMSSSALLFVASPLVAASAHADTARQTTVSFALPGGRGAGPASPHLFDHDALAVSTHATLSSLGEPILSAPLTPDGAFVFRNVTEGSYLVDVHCPTHLFAPARLDIVAAAGAAEGQALVANAWDTFRGNDWGNKGEALAVVPAANAGKGKGKMFEVKVLGKKAYFMERSGFNVMSILKNPMIILGLVSVGIFYGMPKMLDNMDPEVRAEFEEHQRSGPMSALLGGAAGTGGGGQGQGKNFDMAAYLAGSGDGNGSGSGNGNGNGNGGKKGGTKK